MPLQPGDRLGPYEILSLLGAGGMGEVWKARDSRLGREVAIKVLPEDFFDDKERVARFEREARLLATLNHPNIAAVYSFEEIPGLPGSSESSVSSSRHLLVQELLEGETLRQRLAGGALAPRRVVEIAVPIAQGLAAAHEKGIVHRDLKPDNIFLTKEGRVKILDFGLAKLTEGERGAGETQAATMSVHTEPGSVLGTMGYMSPEQVRGHVVDARSDLFSFGSVLYEMLSGQRAFKGATAADTIIAILREDPPELSVTGRSIPASLERVVRHCLEKNPEQRFHSARDLAFALEAVSLGSGASLPGGGSGGTRPIGAASFPLSKRIALPALVAFIALGILGAGAAGWAIGRRRPRSEVGFAPASYGRGTVSSARLGSDGRSVVYAAAWNGARSRLFLKTGDSPDAGPLELPRAEILAVSRSGEMALLLDPQPSHVGLFTGTLARAPVTGGAPREIVGGVSAADWSRDGTTLLAVREEDARTTLEFPLGKVLYATSGHISHPRISPAGDRIAFFDHPIPLDDRGSVAVIDLAGKKTTLTKEFGSVQGLAWSPSGDEVWFTAAELSSIRALHGVSLAGRMRQILPGIGRLRLLDVSKAGLVLLARDSSRMFITGRGPAESGERDLTWLDISFARDLSADRKTLLFDSGADAAGPSYAVGIRGMDGSPVVRLGDGYANAFSPDGAWVLGSRPEPDSPIDVLPTGKGQARRIPVPLPERGEAVFSPDGKRILFTAKEPGHRRRIYAMTFEGGSPTAVSREADMARALSAGAVSPDGKTAALRGGREGILLVPLDGSEVRVLAGALPADVPLRWRADGRAIYVRAGTAIPAAVFLVDVATGHRVPFREFAPADLAGIEAIYNVVLSPDGSAYAYTSSRQLSELFLVEGLE